MVWTAGAVYSAVLIIIMLVYAHTNMSNYWGYNRSFTLSGFDKTIWTVMREWQLSYSLLRHPLLDMMCWPLSVVNGWLVALTGHKCMVYITAVIWWVIDTCSFVMIYKTMNRAMSLKSSDSFMLTMTFFSLAYVMVAAIAPDHMAITMCILSATLYVSGMHLTDGSAMKARSSLLLFLFATGVTATNGLKIILADLFTLRPSLMRRRGYAHAVRRFCLHFLYYIIPALILVGAYYAQIEYVQKPQAAAMEKRKQAKMKKDKAYAERMKKIRSNSKSFRKKQVAEGKLFEFTDATVDRLPSLTENVFGEGIQLHDDHLLQDVHAIKNRRPLFVSYNYIANYIAEALLVLLVIGGCIAGWRNRLLLITLSWFLLDMIIHIGFKFAINDVYIMTAHWAFIIPVSMACLLKWAEKKQQPLIYKTIKATTLTLTLWLIGWNMYWLIQI